MRSRFFYVKSRLVWQATQVHQGVRRPAAHNQGRRATRCTTKQQRRAAYPSADLVRHWDFQVNLQTAKGIGKIQDRRFTFSVSPEQDLKLFLCAPTPQGIFSASPVRQWYDRWQQFEGKQWSGDYSFLPTDLVGEDLEVAKSEIRSIADVFYTTMTLPVHHKTQERG